MWLKIKGKCGKKKATKIEDDKSCTNVSRNDDLGKTTMVGQNIYDPYTLICHWTTALDENQLPTYWDSPTCQELKNLGLLRN